MAKTTEAPVKKTTTVELLVHSHGKATIYRGNGLPMLTDLTEKSVEWLAAHDYKEKDIELIGEKPSNWDTVYPPAQ